MSSWGPSPEAYESPPPPTPITTQLPTTSALSADPSPSASAPSATPGPSASTPSPTSAPSASTPSATPAPSATPGPSASTPSPTPAPSASTPSSTPALGATPAPSASTPAPGASPPSTTPSPTPINSTAPAPTPEEGMPRATLIGLVMGGVLGGLLMLIFVGICAFWYKRRKMRRYGSDNNSGAPSQPPKVPPSEVGTYEPSSLMNVPISPAHLLADLSFGSERPHPAPSPRIAFGPSQSTFSYDELAIATNGFSSLNFLGQGGFGYVHKGVLQNGKTVAVKQLKSGSGQGEREFRAEVEVISRVHHRHLVSLVGYCMAGTQRMLVYEFVPNNTLEFHLHGKDRPTMYWPTRMKIAIGSAKGLAYLHEDCQPKIIHRDIKASNILLDDDFQAKVADFGLAKFLSDTDTHVSTRVMGTFGYLAPEYAASGRLTDKSDVFSFGVVLLELITGRKPDDKTQPFTDDSMVEWARPLLSKALENSNFDPLVDPRLDNNYVAEEMTRLVACAATCVRHSAKRRPRMSQVVRALEGNISLDDLNEGTIPGQSRALGSFEGSGYDTGQYNEDLKKLRKLTLGGQEQGTTSEYSGPSSESGQHPSTSSSESSKTQRRWKL